MVRHPISRRTFLALGLAVQARTTLAADTSRQLTLFAGSALMRGLDAFGSFFRVRRNVPVRIVYGPNDVLEHLLERGAEADIFFTDDPVWMDRAALTRVDLLSSRLVLVSSDPMRPDDVDVGDGVKLSEFLGQNGRFVIGDPSTVTSGRHGIASLTAMGLWQSIEGQVVLAKTVRDALAMIAGGDAGLGVMFGSEADRASGVKVVGQLPDGSHPPVIFPVALTTRAGELAEAFLADLLSPDAAAMLQATQYTILGRRV